MTINKKLLKIKRISNQIKNKKLKNLLMQELNNTIKNKRRNKEENLKKN